MADADMVGRGQQLIAHGPALAAAGEAFSFLIDHFG
jgi:hypothetical protein